MLKKFKYTGTALFMMLSSVCAFSQNNSGFKEYLKTFKTYPFSDPDPIPSQTAIYPYFRFDGFTNTPINKEWKVVELENDYIRVMILPEVGGKIWTAIDKTTNKPYIYYNQVVKFRDVAMRGPWTSGGLEPNYGIIGHTPNCATPVDYSVRSNKDGSVSCFIGVLDLLTRTRWQIEINLPKDKAYFTTASTWNNPTGLEQPYYHWMNTGIKSAGNLEFIYPGTDYIGHEGEHAKWPVNETNGKKINFYEENNFGTYKSYHVIGKQTDFFGAYWHNDEYGMVRYAPYDDKAGKKIWIWGLSRQGMIWEKMLTDQDGQYSEIQSGRLFNQNAPGSSLTPFKHLGFTPHATEKWTEYWYPVNKSRGMVVANASAALNVRVEDGWLKWYCSPVAFFSDKLVIKAGGKTILEKSIEAAPLKTLADSIKFQPSTESISISLVNQHLDWSSEPDFKSLSRPLDAPKPFDWNTAEGLAIQGKELMDQKLFADAELKLKASLALDPLNMTALVKSAELHIRNGQFEAAFEKSRKAIAFDAHHGAANYYYGLSAQLLGKEADAMDGFSVASMSMEFRSASFVEIAKIHARNNRWQEALQYAEKATDYNRYDMTAVQLKVLANKKLGNTAVVNSLLQHMEETMPLNPFLWQEKSNSGLSEEMASRFHNELPGETLLELASFYQDLGLEAETRQLLRRLPENPIALYWLAYLGRKDVSMASELLAKANALSPAMVFPFRTEMIPVLQWAASQSKHWKATYYLALLLHDKNEIKIANELVAGLSEQPDFAPFYALRALWNKEQLEQKERDLKKAIALDGGAWRYTKLLAQQYFGEKRVEEALQLVEGFSKSHPGNFIMDMLYAKTLLLNKKYKECDALLAKMDIIPFEGATDGRGLYWEAKMMQAIQEMARKNYKGALKFIAAAGQWPESLGVGKPYDADIDSRLELFLNSVCYSEMKKQDLAKKELEKLVAFQPGVYNTIRNFQPANHLVTIWARENLGQTFDWKGWLESQEGMYPQFKETFKWVKSKLNKELAAQGPDDPWVRVIDSFLNRMTSR